ncbi:MAG: AAA family ATPase, partial [Oscillospiraceae bacterium]|nr:AAA family ATPase [Oscillospiraceae bacterium]
GLPAPIFSVRHGSFVVTFKNDFYKSNLMTEGGHSASEIVKFCEIPRTRDELQKFTGYSKYYTMSKIVQPLIESGVLQLTMPEKPKSPYQKYVAAK